MARAEAKPIGAPDEVRRFPFGALEIYNIDDLVFGRTVFEPGWRWSEHVKPIAGTDQCQYHHVGSVHTGEVELAAGDLHGLSVHLAARVMAAAPPGRVYVSATTHELVAGAGLAFEDAGTHELKGISGPRQLFALVHGGS